jgi:hypothetical protein
MLWPDGQVALAAGCLALAAAFELRAAELFHEADEFYRSLSGGEETPVEITDHYDDVWRLSGTLHFVASPLLAGAVLAVLGLFAVLAIRWERRERDA